MKSNLVEDENIKLKTKLSKMENELQRKDRFIQDVVYSNNPQLQMLVGTKSPSTGGGQSKVNGKKQQESHLVVNMKRYIKELKEELATRNDEVASLKKHIKYTKITEIDSER